MFKVRRRSIRQQMHQDMELNNTKNVNAQQAENIDYYNSLRKSFIKTKHTLNISACVGCIVWIVY
jgi:hypothetical protein